MKRIFTLLFTLMLINFNVKAQLAPESIAPDFTATDIDGVEHNLYDLLDEGKTVILDVFATWCPPCWSYHQTHALKDIYEMYGPDGTDEMYVFGIEGDASTNLDCLYDRAGCNSSTMGDWVEGVPYPYIDSRDIAVSYGITYFPTIFMVSPNRLVSEIGQLNFERIEALKELAPTLTDGMNPSVIKAKSISTSVCSAFWPVEPTYLISNMGTETITSGLIRVYQNGEGVYEKLWNGEAKPFGIIEEVRVPSDILKETTTYEVALENINGTGENIIMYSDQISFETENAVEISIQLDENAQEDNNRYQILDEDGNVLHERIMNENGALYTNRHTVPSTGCFSFVIYDDGGDGIDGEITVTDQVGNFIFGDNAFLAEGRSDFNVGMVTSVADLINGLDFSVAPNPVREVLNLNVNLDTAMELSVSVKDLSGKTLKKQTSNSFSAGYNSINLEVSDLDQGFYFIVVENADGIMTQKFVKQ